MDRPPTIIREPDKADRAWLEQQLRSAWGSTTIVSRGRAHDVAQAPSLVAVRAGARVGIATFRFEHEQCELLTLDALRQREGIGSLLLAGVARAAQEHDCGRLWLITTNNNLDAMRFYQRRGHATGRGASRRGRRGAQDQAVDPRGREHGIPLHDELEFELLLVARL